MKIIKWLAISLSLYVGLVIAFESMIGILQPQSESTLVIATTSDSGDVDERVLAHLESQGDIYVAANHWPRDWYEQALENPEVLVTIDGQTGSYLAVPATDAEHERVNAENPHSFWFRFVTGFPPRYFLRLEPEPEA